MTYLLSCYYCLSSLFLSVSSSTCTDINKNWTSLTINSVGSRPDHTTHTLHQAANPQFTHQQSVVPHQRDHTSIQTIMTLITNPARQINNSADWHRWFTQRRERLEARLRQAEQAEWNWPSTRARCEVMRIEDEIEQLNAEEFVVPF